MYVKTCKLYVLSLLLSVMMTGFASILQFLKNVHTKITKYHAGQHKLFLVRNIFLISPFLQE